MKNIALLAKVHDPRCQGVAVELIRWLRERGLVPLVESHLARHLDSADGTAAKEIPGRADLVVVLGGDGTLISAARLIGCREVPILAVNLGSLGFLTEITLEELYPALEACIAGDYTTSVRMMLEITIVRDGSEMERHTVLNDAVINKGALARIIDIEAAVDGFHLTTFKADGLIISTPTGSTGYSLSANGPIIHPALDALVITPICPHTLTNRPIVVPGEATVELRLKSENEDVFLTLDGQVGVELRCNDLMIIRKAAYRTLLVSSRKRDFFQVLRTKLKWGER
jgi:NAD+ kinase